MAKKNEAIACGKCGKVFFGEKEKKEPYLYGSPFRVCPDCGEEYFDRRYHEIVVDGIYVEHRLYLPVWQILATVAVISFLAYSLSSYAAWTFGLDGLVVLFAIAAGLTVLMVCLDVTAFRRYLRRRKRLIVLKEESVERVKQRKYIEKLETVGLKVREEYLPDEIKNQQEEIEPIFSDRSSL